ncbi:hypothetical protein TNCV_4261871 [Trichonephila clavipes]|nr:hypothetical protein TNCV_4261871 [Trichonephila clavipes]
MKLVIGNHIQETRTTPELEASLLQTSTPRQQEDFKPPSTLLPCRASVVLVFCPATRPVARVHDHDHWANATSIVYKCPT